MAYFYRFEVDVIIAFSAADRGKAEEVASLLAGKNIRVSLDEIDGPNAGSRQPGAHLADIFARKARFYILLVSRSFPQMDWKEVEQMTARLPADAAPGSSFIPIRLDDTELPGMTTEIKDLRSDSLQGIVDRVADTILREKGHPGPPSQSHDLRSGNVPSTKDKDER